mgnify:CR=1 FL=1
MMREKPITYGELSRWIASGNGEYKVVAEPENLGSVAYNADDAPVDGILIRKWLDPQFHIPTREYMGLED